jgi:hypothetical protein
MAKAEDRSGTGSSRDVDQLHEAEVAPWAQWISNLEMVEIGRVSRCISIVIPRLGDACHVMALGGRKTG